MALSVFAWNQLLIAYSRRFPDIDTAELAEIEALRPPSLIKDTAALLAARGLAEAAENGRQTR